MNEAIRSAIQQAHDTGTNVEFPTGTDDLGLACGMLGGVVIQLGPNEHDMETIGAYDSVSEAYEATTAAL